jgi:hypothetical protein
MLLLNYFVHAPGDEVRVRMSICCYAVTGAIHAGLDWFARRGDVDYPPAELGMQESLYVSICKVKDVGAHTCSRLVQAALTCGTFLACKPLDSTEG